MTANNNRYQMSDEAIFQAQEQAYSDSLTSIASGGDYDATLKSLREKFPWLNDLQVRDQMELALMDALEQGVEEEDIDGSWWG